MQRENKERVLRAIQSGKYALKGGLIYGPQGPLKGSVHPKGERYAAHPYLRMTLKFEGRFVYVLAHCFVWLATKGDYADGLEINHIDGNKLNNSISNLELVNPKENALHAKSLGLYQQGERHYNAMKITPDIYRLLVFDYYDGRYSSKELQKKYGISNHLLSRLIQGNHWVCKLLPQKEEQKK